jgi:hypothetical protein
MRIRKKGGRGKGFKPIYVVFGALRLTPNTPYKYLDFFRNQI